jgi:hypothetical protein
MQHVPEVDALVTASADGVVHFFDVMRKNINRSFHGHKDCKTGVRSFAWSAFGKYIVSAGDRQLLLWDAFTLEVLHVFDTFSSPIVSVIVSDSVQNIFVSLSNKTVCLWHHVTYELHQTIVDPTLQRPSDNITSVIFAPDQRVLFSAGSRVAAWKLERSSYEDSREGSKELEDIVVSLHNDVFHHIIVVKSLGTVQMFQAQSGDLIRMFSVLPIDARTRKAVELKVDAVTGQYLPAIKLACLDKVIMLLFLCTLLPYPHTPAC